MVIDAHSHLGRYREVWSKKIGDALLQQFGKSKTWWGEGERWASGDFESDTLQPSLDRYVAFMDEHGISRSVLIGLAAAPFEARTPPEFVAEAVRRHPDRFIGFHTLDPAGYPDHGPEELERGVRELGLKGVKIYCGYNNMGPNDRRLFPIYQKALDLGIPVFVHTGFTCTHAGPEAYSPFELQKPLLLDEVAATFPELRILMTHFGNPWAEEAIQLMRKYDNVYADTAYGAFPISWKANALVWAKNFGLLHKVLFGSDYPLHSPGLSIPLHRRLPEYTKQVGLEPELTEEDMEMVFSENAVRFFGFADDAGAAEPAAGQAGAR